MLTAASQVLIRNQEYLEADSILLVNHVNDGLAEQLCDNLPESKITCFTSNFANKCSGNRNNLTQVVAAELPTQDFDLIILYYPKAKAEAQMLFDNIRAIAKQTARLLVVGENKGGVKSCLKQLKTESQFARKVDSARHCSLFQFGGLTALNDFVLSNYANSFEITVNQQQIKLVTLPGVFSHGELDKGTELLLESCSLNQPKQILDFATGCGVISCYFAKLHPEVKIVASDVSALALAAAKMSLAANNANAELVLADGISQISQQHKFDHIISNPPFHKGLATDYDITQLFITDSKRCLIKGGNLILVANSFLPYADALCNEFGQFEKLIDNKKFTVYSARA